MAGEGDGDGREIWYPIRSSALRLAAEARAVDPRLYDVLEPVDHVARLHPIADHLLARANDLLDHIVSTCGLTPGRLLPSELTFELALDAAVRQSFHVGDLAHLARVEFRRRRSNLADALQMTGIVALSECDRAIHGVNKALSAIDLAAALASSTSPLRAFTFELDRSLSARRAYARFAARVLPQLEGGAETLAGRFRATGTVLNELVQLPVYADLRIGDRLLLRAAMKRLDAWLALPVGDDNAIKVAPEICRELRVMVVVLGRVNLRQELLVHDSALISEVRERVSAGEDRLPPILVARLQGLWGLSPELDLLLDSRRVVQPAAWVSVLESMDLPAADSGRISVGGEGEANGTREGKRAKGTSSGR